VRYEKKKYFLKIVKEYDMDLQHFRLRHPIENIIRHICKNFPYVHSTFDKSCDIYHLAKHHKVFFPTKCYCFF